MSQDDRTVGSAASASIPLRCLMGKPGPAELGPGLATFVALAEPVRAAFWEALEPNLAPVVDDRAETLVKRFCRRFEIEPITLVPSIRAIRFLFNSAVKVGVGRDDLAADLRALVPEAQAEGLSGAILALFDQAFPALRQAAVLRTIAEHGRVVRAVHWRLDMVKASDHSLKIDMPVATITLQYQEGPNAGQASYQLLPEQALELKRALTALTE